jgi:hypothetical protein
MLRPITKNDVVLVQDMSEMMIALSKHRVLDGYRPSKEVVESHIDNPDKQLLIAED